MWHSEGDRSALTALHALLCDLPHLLSTRLTLLSLELKRAMRTLALLMGLVLAAGVLAATAWIALWIGISHALVSAGVPLPVTIFLVLLLNASAAIAVLLWARSLTHLLALPATMRQLTVRPEQSISAAAAASDGRGGSDGSETTRERHSTTGTCSAGSSTPNTR